MSFFALCNGKEFILYNIQEVEPILHFELNSLSLYWESLQKFLSPENILVNNPFELAKDLGLHLKRLGFDSCESLVFPDVPIVEIGQLSPDMFSLSGGRNQNGIRYVVTFDFGDDILKQLIGKIPDEAIEKLKVRNPSLRQIVRFGDKAFFVTIQCKIGNKLEENDKEIFLPLIINKIIE